MVARAFDPEIDSPDQPLRYHRQEAFCTHVAEGKSLIEAYKQAGYKPRFNNASMLHALPHIRSRVERIRMKLAEQRGKAAKEAAKAQKIDAQAMMARLDRIMTTAEAAGQYTAAVAASKELAILAGIRIERSERGSPHEFADLSDADLIRELRDMGVRIEMDDGKTIEHEPS
jgi:hypothetical protein